MFSQKEILYKKNSETHTSIEMMTKHMVLFTYSRNSDIKKLWRKCAKHICHSLTHRLNHLFSETQNVLSKRFDNYINVHLLTTRYFFLCGFSTTSQTCTCVFVHAFSAWMNSYILLRILHKINLVGQTTEGILHLVWSSLDKALHEFRLDILHVLQ
jgi:hypothetical protein